MSKNIAQMEAQRRELDRQIRKAKRDEEKARKQQLLSERHAIGVDVAEAAGADSIELVARLRSVLMSGQLITYLRQQLGNDSANSGAVKSDGEPGQAAGSGGEGHV